MTSLVEAAVIAREGLMKKAPKQQVRGMRLKGCPKCKGDLHLSYEVVNAEEREGEPYWKCLQCGMETSSREPDVWDPKSLKKSWGPQFDRRK